MIRSNRALVVAGVLALGLGVAVAGTPLPDPPFASGGFVPPDSLALKAELSVAKVITKYAVARGKCDIAAVLGLQLAYEPANPTKIQNLQNEWLACLAYADGKYALARDKLLLYGTPACLDQAGIDAIRTQVEAQLVGLRPLVFCDGDAAAPDPVTGLNIPDFKNEANGEEAAAKLITKIGVAAGKCWMKAVTTAFKYGGVLAPEVVAKLEACFTTTAAKGQASMATLDQRQKLPACLPLALGQTLVDVTVAASGQYNPALYCASPSGAFVEGDS